ncbi:NPCBM/NEW2 domain-containing protein [Alienimonas chondri]|nr:NPCBM/NEW2 domain-containing protein [Alienimonas chondri]
MPLAPWCLVVPLFCAVGVAASADVQVEALPLNGAAASGSLVGAENERVRLLTEDGERLLPFDDLAELRLPLPEAPPAVAESAVLLAGGSVLPVSAVTLVDGVLQASSPGLGTVSLPGAAVRAIRFRPLTGADLERWDELATSGPDGDLVVVRRGERLDKLVGSVGGVGEETVPFLLNGSEVPLPRGRSNFIGIVFGGTDLDAKPVAILHPHVGGALRAASLNITAEGMAEMKLVDGPSVTVPLSGVASIDFAAGSVTPLADLPLRGGPDPDSVWADDQWIVGRNLNLQSEPIGIAGRTFDRGLVLHAPTSYEWRLPKDTGRLRATVGIEDARRTLGVGAVDLTISGDGRELFAQRVTHTDAPLELNVDLTGVRTLTIAIGVAGDPVGDHLALGNARFTR